MHTKTISSTVNGNNENVPTKIMKRCIKQVI